MSVAESMLFATGNANKIREVSAIFSRLAIAIHGLDRLPQQVEEPVEDGATFIANALLKARYYANHADEPTLAEDSGLEVDALGGEPGVYSARYAGATGPREQVDAANNQLLLKNLAGVPDERRTARFVCAMALCEPGRTLAVVRGTIEGRILHEPRGDGGFGYDPLFFVPERGATTAELSPAQKNAISHRGQAVRAMAEVIRLLCGVEGAAWERPAAEG